MLLERNQYQIVHAASILSSSLTAIILIRTTRKPATKAVPENAAAEETVAGNP